MNFEIAYVEVSKYIQMLFETCYWINETFDVIETVVAKMVKIVAHCVKNIFFIKEYFLFLLNYNRRKLYSNFWKKGEF